MNKSPYLGTNISTASVDELYFRGLLEEGETLLALFDGILIDDQGRRIGGLALNDFVILTDQRLVMWARGFFNDTVDGFEWQDVDVAEAGTWDPFHGRVRLALRLPSAEPRKRRISIKGQEGASDSGERVIINTLDYMPAEDVPALARMVEWVGDQVLAGVGGDVLLAAFAENFSMPERPRTARFPFLEYTPEPEPEPEPPKQRWWWPFGRNAEPQPNVDSPRGVIAAYERERRGGGSSPNLPVRSPGPGPSAYEQPAIYDVSRGLRLLLEGPRRLDGTLKRANQIVSGTSELIDGMQDPGVRRNMISGLRRVLDQQEQQQGLLAPVAPVVRAVLNFGEEATTPAKKAETPSAQRIQVRAAVRQRTAVPRAPEAPREDVQPEMAEDQPPPEMGTAQPRVQAGASVRRRINVRPEGPLVNGNGSVRPETVRPDPTIPGGDTPAAAASGRVPVRRSVHTETVQPEVTIPGDTSLDAVASDRAPVRRIVIRSTNDEPSAVSPQSSFSDPEDRGNGTER